MIRSSHVLLALLVTGCSNGLTALGDTNQIPNDPSDTDAPPVDTDLPPPVDTDGPVEPPNNPPTAVAGPDQAALAGGVIELDASGSSDPDGDTLAYVWSMQSSPPNWSGSIINEDRVAAQFFADQAGTYVIELAVDDGEFASTDTVQVTVTEPNEVPVANAGADQYVDEGSLVQLNGSNSYDPDEDPLSYAWTLIDGPVGSGATLDDPSSPLPRFTASVAGVYSIELIVTDNAGNISSPDTVRVTAQADGGGGSSGGSSGGCFSCVASPAQFHSQSSAPAMFLLLPLAFVGLRRQRR